jgi:hypothetical protein
MNVWRIDCVHLHTSDSIALFFRTELAADTALPALEDAHWECGAYEEDVPICSGQLTKLLAVPWPCLDAATIAGMLSADPKRAAAQRLNALLGLPRPMERPDHLEPADELVQIEPRE